MGNGYPAYGGAIMLKPDGVTRAWLSSATVEDAIAAGWTVLDDRRHVERPCHDGAPQGVGLLDGMVTVATGGLTKVTHR
jgi:hypothetical protein